MNDYKASVDKLLQEDEEELLAFIDKESICTTCKLEVDNHNSENFIVKKENSVHFEDNIYSQSLDNFENCQELMRATHSFSRISFENLDLELSDINNEQHQFSHQTHQINKNNINNNNDKVNEDNSIFNDTPSFVCTGVDKALKQLEQDQEHHNEVQNMPETLQKKIISHKAGNVNGNKKTLHDKETQTDLTEKRNETDNLWFDNEFPSEKELEKIDHFITEVTNGNVGNNNKRKYNNEDSIDSNNKRIKSKTREFDKTVNDSMVSVVLNRQNKLFDLSNDLYQYSEYLNQMRTALSKKESSTNINIPTPPVLVGYDNQFDFKTEKRFVKLPIRIESYGKNNSSTSNKLNSHNIKSKIYPQKTEISNRGTTKNNPISHSRNINNSAKNNYSKINDQVNSTKKNQRQSTIKEAFAIHKDNHKKPLNDYKNINNIANNTKININKNINGLEKNQNDKINNDNLSDSASMYQFNPLGRNINVKK
ncbi:probable serine/threonine-protein kinase clkA [Microplitis mediator]|uniref:probable serine/threonine-protein kinase clkA n=1 Tax=Microplitis mediator TaxID=375433 RepID=UPI002557AF90|nr:probable serine/threonine-protein kinase clkA [Microplitis mediator]XP_057330647.1 probable serine/threonine-protein kinase clkA [Microplitis mediator]XP_057330648.1 probable serine/threonine-protein kinase clkA [Microplitis mediator]